MIVACSFSSLMEWARFHSPLSSRETLAHEDREPRLPREGRSERRSTGPRSRPQHRFAEQDQGSDERRRGFLPTALCTCRALARRLLYNCVRTNPSPYRGMGKTQMKPIFFSAFGCLLACVTGAAASTTPRTELAIFPAFTVSTDQSARVVISNIAASEGTNSTQCEVQVKFFGPDGSLEGEAAELQLKPGESRSVTVSHPQNLLRASVGVQSDTEVSTACQLKARVEVFDVQTGTTFVSLAADPSSLRPECASSSLPASLNIGQDVTSAVGRRRASRRYRTRPLRPPALTGKPHLAS